MMDSPAPLPPHYSRRARRFHWWMFGFVALAYLVINLHDLFERGNPMRRATTQIHILFGLVVLALMLPRLLHRLRNAPPPIVPPIAVWEAWLSRLTHLLLYAFLIVQPLLGLLSVWLGGRGIALPFTGLELPSPLSENHDMHEKLEDIHKWIGEAFYYVIGLHIAGALWHHYVRRDTTLRRIIG